MRCSHSSKKKNRFAVLALMDIILTCQSFLEHNNMDVYELDRVDVHNLNRY